MTDLFDATDPPRNAVLPEPCPACGSHHYRVEPGVGPHAAGLRCAVCGKHCGWMSKAEYDEYRGVT